MWDSTYYHCLAPSISSPTIRFVRCGALLTKSTWKPRGCALTDPDAPKQPGIHIKIPTKPERWYKKVSSPDFSRNTCSVMANTLCKGLHFHPHVSLIFSSSFSWCRNQRRNCWASCEANCDYDLAPSYTAISIFLGSEFSSPPLHPWHHILHSTHWCLTYLLPAEKPHKSGDDNTHFDSWICVIC